MIDFELYWETQDVTSNVIEYSREHNICSGIALVSFTVPISDTTNYGIWDLIEPYEGSVKKGKFYISEIENNAPKSTITFRCQDGSKRLVDYFISELYTINDGDWSGAWLETVLNLAGVSYSINSAGSGVRLPGHSLGYDSAYSIVMTLLQQSGWYMYFDANGTAQIGNLDRDGSVQETYDTTEILNISVDKNDKMLRNRAVVYGNQIQLTEEVTTKWNYDETDKRSVVVASPHIRDIGTAQGIASKLLDEFARITVEKELEVTGFRDVYIGETVKVQSNIFNGNGKITSINVRMSDKGATTTLVLDERCPRLFTYWSPYYEGVGTYVYIGTWGDGVYRKPISSDTWEAYNTGLTDLYVRDLYVKDGNLVVVANNGFAYRRQDTSPAWLRIWHDDFVASGVGTYLEQDVKARACTINEDNELVVGLRDSAGDYSWVYTLDLFGNDIAKEQIITSGSDSHRLYDIASYGARENIISTVNEGEIVTSSGIQFITINNNEHPCLGYTTNAVGTWGSPYTAPGAHKLYNPTLWTSFPPEPDSGVDVLDGTDYEYDSLDTTDQIGYYYSYNIPFDDKFTNDLIAVHKGTGSRLLHYKVTPSGLYSHADIQYSAFTSTGGRYIYFDRDNEDYYIMRECLVDINSSYALNRVKVIDGTPTSETEYFDPQVYSYYNNTNKNTLLNDKFYVNGTRLAYICIVETDMIDFVLNHDELEIESGAKELVITPVVNNEDGWLVAGTYYIRSGNYNYWKGFTYDGTTKTLSGTLATSMEIPNFSSAGQHTEGWDAGIINTGFITSYRGDNPTLMVSSSVYGGYNDGTPYEYCSHFYLYVDENGDMTGELLEDSFADGTSAHDMDLAYGTDFMPKYERDMYGLVSRKKPRMFASRDDPSDLLVINFYDVTDRSLINSVDLYDNKEDMTKITGISPVIDDSDQTLYIKIWDDNLNVHRMWGISYPDGTVTKKFSNLGIYGHATATYMQPFITVGSLIWAMQETATVDYCRHYHLYDYVIPSGTATVTPTFSGDIIRHKNENFGIVLNTNKLSKVEISKDSPTIVYNPASGILDTDLYYSYRNAEDTFSGVMTLGNLNDLRVFDANFSGGAGLDENYFRYIGYVKNDGIYSRTMPSGSPVLMTTISGAGTPVKLEVANYGVNPYMFVATTSPQKFYQRDPYSGYTFEDKSVSLPSGAITIIRLDDRL